MTDRHHARRCQGCDSTGFDVAVVRIDGEKVDLCPDCNRKVALGDASIHEIDSDETLPDPELDVDVPVDLLDELSRTRREDYTAVVLGGYRVTERAAERGVSQPAVSQNVSTARDQLRDLATEATAQ